MLDISMDKKKEMFTKVEKEVTSNVCLVGTDAVFKILKNILKL